MLKRRTLLNAGLGVALAAPAIHRAAIAKGQTLRIGYILPLQSQLGAGATTFADEVAKRCGGRIAIQQFPDSVLGGEVEMLKGVQLGTIDLAFITGAPLPNVLPEIGVFNIPFLFRNAAHAHAVLDGSLGETYRKQFSTKELIALAWGENGMRHMTNSRHAIATPDDLKGLRMRLPQSEVMMLGFKALGADVSPLAFPQLYEALQSGKFDGQENPIATIRSAKFDQVQKFLTMSAHVYDPAVIVMSPDAFDDLTSEDKASFGEAARLGGRASRVFAAEAETTGVAALKQSGMQVLTEIDRNRFATAMASANTAFEQRFGAALIQQIRSAA